MDAVVFQGRVFCGFRCAVWALALAACDGAVDAPDSSLDAAVLRDAASYIDGPIDAAISGNEDGGVGTDAYTRRVDGGPACVDCGPCIAGEELNAFEQMLIALPPQTWFEAPNSHLRDVCVPADRGVPGIVGCTAVVSAWSGGAYDSVRRRMIVWGGGHADYAGNELYAFDLRTGTWSRLTEPSLAPSGVSFEAFYNRDPLPDGQPVSRHTYDGVEFLPDVGLLWAHGGSRAGDGNSTRATWMYDPTSGWLQRAEGYGGFDLASAYDPTTRRVFVFGGMLSIYDVESDTWTLDNNFGFPPLWPRYAGAYDLTGVVDSRRGLFWAVGGFCRPAGGSSCEGTVFVWDIARNAAVTNDWVTTGAGFYSNRDHLQGYEDQLSKAAAAPSTTPTRPASITTAAPMISWRGQTAARPMRSTSTQKNGRSAVMLARPFRRMRAARLDAGATCPRTTYSSSSIRWTRMSISTSTRRDAAPSTGPRRSRPRVITVVECVVL